MFKRSCLLRRFVFGIVFVLASLSTCTIAKAVASVSLNWTPNLDPAVSGYNIYYGGASRNYTNMVTVGSSTNAAIDGLVEGKNYYFAVTAFDDFGDESDYSVETVYVVPGFLMLTPGANPGDPMHIQFPVAPAHWYELQISSDLINWATTWEVIGVSNTWVQFDSPVNGPGPMFFRLVLH